MDKAHVTDVVDVHVLFQTDDEALKNRETPTNFSSKVRHFSPPYYSHRSVHFDGENFGVIVVFTDLSSLLKVTYFKLSGIGLVHDGN